VDVRLAPEDLSPEELEQCVAGFVACDGPGPGRQPSRCAGAQPHRYRFSTVLHRGARRDRCSGDERFNVLTVVANESCERFVAQLQSEVALEYQEEIEARYGKSIADLTNEERARIAEEYGEGILPPNLVEIMANLMAHTTPPVRLTRGTLLEI